MSNGLLVDTVGLDRCDASAAHTLLVAGAERSGIVSALEDERLRFWALKAAAHVDRLVSVCVGAFALAEWGLLDGKRATTHWSVTHLLQSRYPRVKVDHSAIYIRDGHVWTAGGITTGIDMALAMVESDSSRLVAGQVAKALVMSSRRVGNQAQYSTELLGQSGRYAALIEWMRFNLDVPMSIASLAERAGESQRSFCRRFTAATRQTPAAFVETLRLQSAMRHLQGDASVKAAARRAGFSSAEQLGKVFQRRLDMSPGEYRRQHGRQDRKA